MKFQHSAAVFSSVIALAASACASRTAAPLASAETVTCPGGTIRSAADAASYGACNVVHGDLTVSAADLEDLTALSSLHQVTGTLRITDCPALDDLDGLQNLSSVGALELHQLSDLDDLAGLENLGSAGRVEVTANSELATLQGLQGLHALERLVVSGNSRLYNANGLGELHAVGVLVVADNQRLNSLTGLRSLESARSVEIRNNPVLCGANLLPNLKRVDSPLVLQANRGISKSEARLLLDRTSQGGVSTFALDAEQALQTAAR